MKNYEKSIDIEFYKSLFSSAQNIYKSEGLNLGETSQSYEANKKLLMTLLKGRTKNGLAPNEVSKIIYLILDSGMSREHQQSLSNIVCTEAERLRKEVFSDKVSIMAPIEISSYCSSGCIFCGWKSSNKEISRFQITKLALLEQADRLIDEGFYHLELAGGDDLNFIRSHLLEYINSLRELSVSKKQPIKISVCFSPFPESFYKKISDAGGSASFVWQEAYDPVTYQNYIKSGPKAHGVNEGLQLDLSINGYLNRLTSQERAIRSGLQAGLGTMLGLSPHLGSEILSVIIHGKKLIEHYGSSLSPIILGMPTWNKITTDYEDGVSDKSIEDIFSVVAAIYLLAFPDGKAWPFANCRVPMDVQAKAVSIASPFTSTSVNIGPGGYINSKSDKALNDYFHKSNRDLSNIDRSQILMGEQFRHYYSSHSVYLEKFNEFGINNVVPEDQL